MNMNDKNWNEFWDDETEDRDDDEQNDIGSDVDANNDETFDNAAEWNEDEHEELIARDSILSHSSRNRNNNNNNNHARESSNVNGRSRGRNCAATNFNSNDRNEPRREEFAFFASTAAWDNNTADILSQATNRHHQPQQMNRPIPDWQASLESTQRLHSAQVPLPNIEELRMKSREQALPSRFVPKEFEEELFSQSTPTGPSSKPKVIRVDDLERQLMKTSINQNVPTGVSRVANESNIPFNSNDQPKRSSWSPFAGKDLFNSPDSQTQAQLNSHNLMSQNLMSRQLSFEQQQRILLQQQQIVHQQQQQLQQMALVKHQQELLQQQQQLQQQHHQHMVQQHQIQKQEPPRLLPQNAQCFTVEELERQMIADRSNRSKETKTPDKTALNVQQRLNKGQESTRQNNRQSTHNNNSHDRRNGEKYDRSERNQDRNNRDHRDRREHRDRRDDRENRHYDSRKKATIIPPQVQLSVIEKERRLHSLTTMHPDEFLQDIMPTSRTGFLFNRHSTVSSEKATHDGVLTEKERSWLTRIQEKIQGDYDDNVDQDYYYLLYFNRSSMTEGATRKPSGPGVLDRRFIPRERLLYNTSD